MRHRESAICLRTTDYSETSQVVAFLTRGEGVVHLIAKGSKRPKSKSGGAIDLLAEGDLVYTTSRSGGLGTLVEFSETVTRRELRGDIGRLNAGVYLIELVGDMLAIDDPHVEVFDLLHNALERLGQTDAPVSAVIAYFQWRLLRHVGLLGDMSGCVACGKAAAGSGGKGGGMWFSSIQGGLVCEGCADGPGERIRLDGQTLAGLAALLAAEGGRRVALPDAQAQAAGRMLNYHITHQLGKPLKMAPHVLGAKG
jgi:DNA repair protein RecO (recombination protein O)